MLTKSCPCQSLPTTGDGAKRVRLDTLRAEQSRSFSVPSAVRVQQALAPEPNEMPEPEPNETRATGPDETPEFAPAAERDGTPASASEAAETPEPSLQLWARDGW